MSYVVDLALGTIAVTGPGRQTTTVTPTPTPAPAPTSGRLPVVTGPPGSASGASRVSRELQGPNRDVQRDVTTRPRRPSSSGRLPPYAPYPTYPPGAEGSSGPTFNITIEGGSGGAGSGGGTTGGGGSSGGGQYELPPEAELVVAPERNGPALRLSPLTVGLGAAAAIAAFYLMRRS